MRPLYQISNEYQAALDALSSDETLTPAMIDDSLALIKEEFDKKCENVAAYIKNLEADIQAGDTYMENMAARINALEKKKEQLQEYLLQQMNFVEMKKFKTPEFNARIQITPARVVVQDESKVPEQWFIKTQITRLDKVAVKAAIEAGEVIEGVTLERGQTLIIK